MEQNPNKEGKIQDIHESYGGPGVEVGWKGIRLIREIKGLDRPQTP